MKAKFEEFNDGIADVCNVNGEDRLERVKTGPFATAASSANAVRLQEKSCSNCSMAFDLP